MLLSHWTSKAVKGFSDKSRKFKLFLQLRSWKKTSLLQVLASKIWPLTLEYNFTTIYWIPQLHLLQYKELPAISDKTRMQFCIRYLLIMIYQTCLQRRWKEPWGPCKLWLSSYAINSRSLKGKQTKIEKNYFYWMTVKLLESMSRNEDTPWWIVSACDKLKALYLLR